MARLNEQDVANVVRQYLQSGEQLRYSSELVAYLEGLK